MRESSDHKMIDSRMRVHPLVMPAGYQPPPESPPES
jgi:hypothetical protein